MPVGSEPATSGSVIAKHERTSPFTSGRSHCSFCAGVAWWSSVCMLPSSGAWQLSTYAPIVVRPHSAETNAIASGPRPMPPNSAGMCGAQRPSSFARPRSAAYPFRHPPSVRIRRSATATSSCMNARTRSRTAVTSGGSVKSIDMGVSSAVRRHVVVRETDQPLGDHLAARHARVLRLALLVAKVELLDDAGHLEEPEDEVVRHRRDVAAAPLSVAL